MGSESEYIPYEHGNLSSGKTLPVSVIASFDKKGKITPLYIRINDQAYRIHTFKEMTAGTVTRYECKSGEDGVEISFVCIYFRSSGEWKLELGK